MGEMTERRSRRTVQAEETKRLILETARRLFAERGYGATSIAEVAAGAGVAVPTVYQSVGSKPTLLLKLVDHIDEEAGIRALARELRTSEDAHRVLELQVRMTRQIAERCGDIVAALQSAAGVDRDLAEPLAAGMDRHRAGAKATVERLASLGALRTDLTRARAAAVLASLTAPRVWTSMVGEFGWKYDEAEAWLNDLLRRELFGG
jgi:AcrR family transcriptional regulator